MARVLLVLGGMHPRVVRDGADHAAVDADVGGGVQRVRRHVQPTCFIAQKLRAPPSEAPNATSKATFSLGAHSE